MRTTVAYTVVLILLLALPYAASTAQAGQEQGWQGYIPVAFVYIGNTTLSGIVAEQKITLEPLEAVVCEDSIVVVYGFNSSTPSLVAVYVKSNVTSPAAVEKCLLEARSRLGSLIGVELADIVRKVLAAYPSLLKFKMEAARELPVVSPSSLEGDTTALIVTTLSPTPAPSTTPATKAGVSEQAAAGVCSADAARAGQSSQHECVVSTPVTAPFGEAQERYTTAPVRATSLTSSAEAVSKPGDYDRLAIVLLPSLAMAGLVALIWKKKVE